MNFPVAVGTFVLALILVAIIIHLASRRNGRYRKTVSRTTSTLPKRVLRIDDCISDEDVQYKLTKIDAKIIYTIEKSKTEIQRAVQSSNGRIQVKWLSSYKKILEVSSNLDANIRAHANKGLQSSRFVYYTSLHFRSMCAADIAYAEYKSIDQTFSEINQLLLDIKNKTIRVSKSEKDQFFQTKDEIKELRRIYLEKVNALNRNTARLRDKIGSECGQRGREWRAARLRHN